MRVFSGCSQCQHSCRILLKAIFIDEPLQRCRLIIARFVRACLGQIASLEMFNDHVVQRCLRVKPGNRCFELVLQCLVQRKGHPNRPTKMAGV